jgi:hypothetical protein
MARRVFLHLYMMRVPLIILFVLGFGLPLAFRSPMLRGLADLTNNQIALLAFGAFLLLSAAMTCCFLVLLYGTARADGKREPAAAAAVIAEMPKRWPLSGYAVGLMYVLGGWCLLRFLMSVEQTMVAARINTNGLAVYFGERAGLGIFLGTLVIIVVFLLDLYLSDPRSAPQIEVFAFPLVYLFREWGWVTARLKKISDARPALALKLGAVASRHNRLDLLLVRILGPGYGSFDASGSATVLYPGHAFAGFLAAVCFVLYFLAGRGFYNRLSLDEPFASPLMWDAVLLQVILLLLLACWVLAAFAFFFDRFRVPFLIPIAAILFLTSRLGSSDHVFHTFERSSSNQGLLTPAEKFAKTQDHIIVVAAAGGGIQAAAWTSEVLCGLRREIGPALETSVLAISGVSGGSVGTMFYLRCLESPPGDMLGAEAARNSSLEAIAWGLAHPDLRRAVFPRDFFGWPGDDRGWALERALRKNAQFSPIDRKLASAEVQQKWPVVLFNSTEVRTGDPIVFSNSRFPQEPDQQVCTPDHVSADPDLQAKCNHRLHGFHTVYSGRDVLLETAVRMSAAFPYVSPAARSDYADSAEHFVDGGYFDNSGLFTLTEWMKAAAPDLSAPPKPGMLPPARRKILILRVDAFPDGNWTGPGGQPRKWVYQFAVPVEAILHVRSEGQLVRDRTESADLLEILSRRGYDATAVTARYVPRRSPSVAGKAIHCEDSPPLTWHLTEVEKNCIMQNWDDIKAKLVDQVKCFLEAPTTAPAPSQAKVETQQLQKGLYVEKVKKP